MRTKNSIRNVIAALIGQFVSVIVALIARNLFLKVLTSEYLGLDGLFSNIIAILSLIELGVGPAMTFSLYKPLAENNKNKIKSLIQLYQKLYFLIGFGMLILGIGAIPFLEFFINEMPNINNIYLIYIIFVINTVLPYFFTYKTSLLITDQKQYIYYIYHYSVYVLYNIMQIIILFLTKNYILYLLMQTLGILLQNIILYIKVNRMYPYLKEHNVEKLDKKTEKVITKNVKAMFMHKVGSVLINATDNIIISRYVGLIAVGLYSNYYLITNNLKKIISQFFDSVISSVGNLAVKENMEKVVNIFEKVFFFNYYIYTLTSICLLVLFNDFIFIWVGQEYLFSVDIVLIIVINYYLSGMRKSVLTFKDAMGLYWYDRYKPLLEGTINIVISIILSKYFGVFGVFLGTAISNITTNIWIEPLVLYKHGFNKKVNTYFKQYFVYLFSSSVICMVIAIISNLIFTKITLLIFIFKMLFVFIITNAILILTNLRNNNFIYFKNLVIQIIHKLNKKI